LNFKFNSSGFFWVSTFFKVDGKYRRFEGIKATGSRDTQIILEIRTSVQGKNQRVLHIQRIPIPKTHEEIAENFIKNFSTLMALYCMELKP